MIFAKCLPTMHRGVKGAIGLLALSSSDHGSPILHHGTWNSMSRWCLSELAGPDAGSPASDHREGCGIIG